MWDELKLFFNNLVFSPIGTVVKTVTSGAYGAISGGLFGAAFGSIMTILAPTITPWIEKNAKSWLGKERGAKLVDWMKNKNWYEKARDGALMFGAGGAAIGAAKGAIDGTADGMDTSNGTWSDEIGTIIGTVVLGAGIAYAAKESGAIDYMTNNITPSSTSKSSSGASPSP